MFGEPGDAGDARHPLSTRCVAPVRRGRDNSIRAGDGILNGGSTRPVISNHVANRVSCSRLRQAASPGVCRTETPEETDPAAGLDPARGLLQKNK